MIKRYEKYKESGIEWLGEIPEHWVSCKLKHIGEIKGRIGFKGYSVTDLVDEDTEGRAIVLGGTNVMKSGFLSYEKLTYLSEFKYLESPEIILNGGEILITKVGAGVGENAIYFHNGERVTINPNVMIFVPNQNSLSAFINYFLLSDLVKSSILLESRKSGAQPAINQSYIKSVAISLPTLTEQTQIANFLDFKTTIIDDLIGQKEKLINLLKEKRQAIINKAVTKGLNPNAKMKDSGIEWLGEIPEEWSLVKLKHLLADVPYSLKTGPFGSQLKNIDTVEEGPFVVYTQRNVIDNQFLEFKDYITQEKQETLSAFNVNEGDILLSTRGTIGKAALVPNNSPKGILHPCLIKLRLDNKKILNDWALLYINNSSYFIENVLLESDSTTIEVIYGNTLKEVFIPLPKSISIQFEILQYTNDKLNLFEDTISKEKDVIAKLKDYRQSLISESVTGKIDVRDWKPVNN